MHFTLLLDGSAEWWASTFGLTYAVVADPNYAVAQYYAPNGSFGIPMYAVLDRELRIRALQVNGDVGSLVNQLLAEDPPEVDWPMP